ncbi:MAG: site-specific integrase [Actinomycetia bacterium]|nr:site-specific integrase [Actinomycetes bacterium]
MADVEEWLSTLPPKLSTRSIRLALDVLRRSMDRDLVHPNVAALVQEVPVGRPGRPSKSLTLPQSKAILEHLRPDPFYTYFAVSLMTGARTEELRVLTWSHTFLELDESTDPPTPPHINVWRSVRRGSDTKTKRSRRSLALPSHCVVVLHEHRSRQNELRRGAGERWVENDLVFSSSVGIEWDASNVRKDFRRALVGIPGIDPAEWTPRELRHSFVSTLSDHGVPIEEIAKLVGHSNTSTTETVYRHQIHPVIQTGASAMDEIFDVEDQLGWGGGPSTST